MNARLLDPAGAGPLLRDWRIARRLSQLDLSLEAGISTRHLSCLETGKAQPSREMVARLADALSLPLRERNALLVAAGFAAQYPESPLDGEALASMSHAIDAMLAQQEPYPAFALDRHWNVVRANEAALRVNRYLLGRDSTHANLLRATFDPEDLGGVLDNFEEVALDLLQHLRRALDARPGDATGRALLDELLARPGLPDSLHATTRAQRLPLVTTRFRRGDERIGFFSTITVFGTARDVTLEELHIECCHPIDDATRERCRALALTSP